MNQSFELFVRQLRLDLAQALPGRAAQVRMAPAPRADKGVDVDTPRPDTRQGGVLVLLYPHQERLHLPLILRPTYTGVHSGQVGFPGGGYEVGDADLAATALREAHEEIGVQLDSITVLGQLSLLYVFASNYLVHPTVAWTPHRPTFAIDPHEVDKLLEVALLDLLNPLYQRREAWQLRGRTVQVPLYQIQDQRIWGATAMMLSELLALPALQLLSGSE